MFNISNCYSTLRSNLTMNLILLCSFIQTQMYNMLFEGGQTSFSKNIDTPSSDKLQTTGLCVWRAYFTILSTNSSRRKKTVQHLEEYDNYRWNTTEASRTIEATDCRSDFSFALLFLFENTSKDLFGENETFSFREFILLYFSFLSRLLLFHIQLETRERPED